ncbi:hypothetical protein J3R30DRAFT_3708120 [Lentinula aciculospora]|uniref:Wax synthase domain-containing protein n=1 Tax=Lentinula aciculospora TaxID=153920 RepID=A0A9W9A3X2_9AGAR|nr:hypothetical protein J3R30DRAFT_3708120 [Lentinula aciculospora]
MFGVPSRSIPAALIQLYTAFFISGSMHSLGDYMIGREYIGVSFWFFFLQPFAITFEELVKLAVQRLELYDHCEEGTGTLHARVLLTVNATSAVGVTVRRMIGYAWVVWWLTATAPLLIDPAMQAGLDREPMFPRSSYGLQ